MADQPQLPVDVSSALQGQSELNAARLAALGIALAAKRKEAVAARKESGIEDVWMKAEEAYIGIDDTNRGTFAKAKWAKPTTMSGPLTASNTRANSTEITSDAYVKMTSRYVDAGYAKLCEILLPADEKAFSFTSTPVPELISKLKDTSPAVHGGLALTQAPAPPTPGAPAVLQGGPPQAPNAGNPPAAPGSSTDVPVTVRDIAQETIDLAETAAKKAETRIYGWMVKSKFRAETRKVVFDSARIGVGVLKGPFPRSQVSRAFDKDTSTLKIVSKVQPAYEWKSPWNIYPDAACGENVHDGDYIFESDPYTTKKLKKLKDDPGYIAAAIDKVIADGPNGASGEAATPTEKTNRHQFIVWHFYGMVGKLDLVASGSIKPEDQVGEQVYAICTMVNDTVIRAVINPLDSGEFPYHTVPWQRRVDHWAGVGVAEQIEMPQRGVNAAIRTLFNNAGKAAGSIIVMDRGSVVPADGSWAITPDKIFYKTEDATADDVRKAFAFFQVPNMGKQLMAIIELCMKLAEEVTNIPLVTQGQSGTTTPETYGATQLQNNNANQLLRSIGYAFDDHLTEPVVLQSYEYLLLDPTVPADEKGDWTIDAHGSVALVERAIQDQFVQSIGPLVPNAAYGVNPKRWMASVMRSRHLRPSDLQYTEAEQAKIDSQPAPAAPAIEVAKIKSADAKAALAAEQQQAAQQAQIDQALQKMADETKLQVAAMRKEVDELRVKRDTDRDSVYVAAEDKRTQNEYAVRMEELQLRERLAMLDYANKNQLQLEDVKARLADTSMKLQVQRELSHVATAADLHKHHNPVVTPPTEPAGTAPDGQAFAK